MDVVQRHKIADVLMFKSILRYSNWILIIGDCVMMETINLLNSIKQRPEIYVGQKSLSRLISFIRGYEYSKCSIFEGFYEFVCKYYNYDGHTCEFEKVILLYSGFNK